MGGESSQERPYQRGDRVRITTFLPGEESQVCVLKGTVIEPFPGKLRMHVRLDEEPPLPLRMGCGYEVDVEKAQCRPLDAVSLLGELAVGGKSSQESFRVGERVDLRLPCPHCFKRGLVIHEHEAVVVEAATPGLRVGSAFYTVRILDGPLCEHVHRQQRLIDGDPLLLRVRPVRMHPRSAIDQLAELA